MISLFYYSQLRFYHEKLLDTPGKDRQVLGFVNPVVDSDDEDDDIFEPERRFSGAFNSFANQWYVKKDKNAFKLAFRFHAFPAVPILWENQAHKKFIFQHYGETYISQIIVLWSNGDIKMQRNVVFRLKREIKML